MASVTYTINGQHNSKGINDALSSLGKLKGAVSSINTVLKGAVFVKVIGQLKSISSGALNAFSVEQKSLSSLSRSIASNAKLSETSFKNISALTEKLSSNSLFGGEELNNQAAYLASLKLTENQIGNVLAAATELSSAGIGNLESNVKSLSQTLNGNAGQLKKIIPELGKMTEEQLRAGNAIDLVNERYAGFAENLSANTFEGQQKAFTESIEGVQKTLGKVFSGFAIVGMEAIQPILGEFGKWFSENGPKIGATLISGFKILEDIIKNLKTNFNNIFQSGMWNKFFDNLGGLAKSFCTYFGNLLIDLFKNAIEAFRYGFSHLDWFKLLWTPLITILENIPLIGEAIGGGLEKGIDAVQKAINSLDKGGPLKLGTSEATKVSQTDFTTKLGDTIKEGLSVLVGTDVVPLQKKYYEEALAKMNLTNFSPVIPSPANYDTAENIEETKPDQPAETVKTQSAAKPEKPEKPEEPEEPEETKWTALEIAFTDFFTINILGKFRGIAKEATSSTESLNSFIGSMKGLSTNVIAMMGQFGTALSGNPLDIITQSITGFASMIMSIENLSKTLNFIDTIIEGIRVVIEPLVNELFAPFVLILEKFGMIIGNLLVPLLNVLITITRPILNLIIMILDILAPIITTFGSLLSVMISLSPIIAVLNTVFKALAIGLAWVYNNIIMPVANAIIWLMTGVANVLADIWNGIREVVKTITLGAVVLDRATKTSYEDVKLREVSFDDANAKIDTSYSDVASNSGSSGSASYTAAKDIYVNIYYNNSYVNGDAREIAISLKKEIQAAEALGY